MTEQRTYGEEEIREIVALASRRESMTPPSTAPGRLTLAELQEVGREVGLDPADVARAAAALDGGRALAPPVRRELGMPVGVSRVMPLARAPTDQEWERLVAELRATFGARGRVSTQGGLREWSNGNLHAYVEPTGTGYRLRLGTVKGNARVLNLLGATGIATTTMVMGAMLTTGGATGTLAVPWMLGAAGVGAIVANLVRLPRWARERARQMEHVAEQARAIVADAPAAAEPGA
jgi:hypothetical protein